MSKCCISNILHIIYQMFQYLRTLVQNYTNCSLYRPNSPFIFSSDRVCDYRTLIGKKEMWALEVLITARSKTQKLR